MERRRTKMHQSSLRHLRSRMPLSGSGALLVSLWMVLWAIGSFSRFAQKTSRTLEDLEREFTDPLTTLPQLFKRYFLSRKPWHGRSDESGSCPGHHSTNPTKHPLAFRPTHSADLLIGDRPDAGGGSRTDLGDIQLFDLVVSPWPSPETGLRFGVGPTFVFPTATSKFAGEGAWQVGPAFAAVYTGLPGFVIGFLLQNPISFAYTSPDRPSQNTLAFQPVVLFSLGDGWYLRSADATWLCGWRRDSPSLLPLSLGLGRVMVRPGLPPMNFYVSVQWMAYHENAPIAPEWSINFGITIAFSQFGKRD
jgi:hypothetical protein